jgi:hypothetical protein
VTFLSVELHTYIKYIHTYVQYICTYIHGETGVYSWHGKKGKPSTQSTVLVCPSDSYEPTCIIRSNGKTASQRF